MKRWIKLFWNFTFSCSGFSVISPIYEPGEVDRFDFCWLSIKNSTGLPGDGVRAIAEETSAKNEEELKSLF